MDHSTQVTNYPPGRCALPYHAALQFPRLALLFSDRSSCLLFPFGLLSVRYTELTGLNLAPLCPGRQTPYIRRLWNASYCCLLLASRLLPSIRHAVVPLPTEADCLPEASVQLLHDNPTLA